MATSNYNVNVTTTAAVAAMTRLQQSTSRVNAAFGGLKTAVGGLALGAAISSALRYADAINDIAEATGIGTANILGFSRAVAANGGSAESAQASILRLSQSIDDAATGSDKMRSQFAQVGVSLQDLATLSEQDILNKTVAGLAKIEDNSKRIALATDILGKSARGINFAGVASSLPGAIAQSQQYAASQKAAAELQDKLNYSIDQFRMSLLKALGPLITFLNTLKPEQIDRFVDAVVKIGGAAVAITAVGTAIGKILPLLTSIGGIAASAFLLFNKGAAQAGKTVAGLDIRLKGFLTAFAAANGIFAKLFEVFRTLFIHATKTLPFLLGGLARMIPGIGLVVSAMYALNEIISLVFNYDPLAKFIQGLKSVGAALGIISPQKEFKVTEGLNTGSGPRGSIGTGREAEEQRKKNERTLGESDLDRKKKALQGITAEFGKQSLAIAEAIVKEAGYINLSEDQVEVLKAQDEVYKRLADSIRDLEQQKIGLKDEDKKLIPVINAQIAALEKQAKVDANMIGASVQALQGQRLMDLDRLANIERITAAMERQQDLADAINQIRRDGAQELADAEAEGAQASMTLMQRQMDQIIRANDKAARSRSESFANLPQFAGELNSAQAQELANGLALIEQNYAKLTTTQINNLTRTKTFAEGLKQAFDEYADNASNAAQHAANMFNTATRGMEDAIVNFAKTGKLEFKSFIGSIVEMILRSQIQQLLAKSFGGLNLFGGGGSGSLFPALFGLPGFANGGMIPNNGPVIVGERGPEILAGAGGRSVIPNNALGGSTNVTYNINAVDASSFRSLVASDPEFMFAVTEQGRRRMPNSRR